MSMNKSVRMQVAAVLPAGNRGRGDEFLIGTCLDTELDGKYT